MKKSSLLICLVLGLLSRTLSQVSINSDNSLPVSSAILDVKSSNRGLLPPRMSFVQIGMIASPDAGLLIFCNDCGAGGIGAMDMFMNGLWYTLDAGCLTPASPTAGVQMAAPVQITWNWNPVQGAAWVVAPVSKTVIYGTVNNIPGEPAKCRITSNLGADHQAYVVSDDTEASAGWYWQFNRKQGYRHDSTTRTPNTTRIITISEELDWETANDPRFLA